MIALQFCLSFILANLALVTATGLVNAERRTLGYDAQHIISMRVRYPVIRDPNAALKWEETFQSVVLLAARLPQVQAATVAYPGPATRDFLREFLLPGYGVEGERLLAIVRRVAPSYFAVMGIPLAQGRTFHDSETSSSRTAIVNAALGRRYFPQRAVLGQPLSIRQEGPSASSRQIIGVVGDTLESRLDDSTLPTIYLPGYSNWMELLVRSDSPADLEAAVRRIVHGIEPRMTVEKARPLDAAIEAPLGRAKGQTFLLGSFAVAALVLTTMGLAALVLHTCSIRSREYAIRLALGASERQVLGVRFRQTLRAAAIGLGAGVAIAIGLARSLQGMLFHVGGLEVRTLAMSATIFIFTGFLVSYMAMRGVSEKDMGELLRSE
jgi:putative ABC transport system permease protein